MPTLRDGTVVDDRRLDRIYVEDWRSLRFSVTRRLPVVQVPKTKTWSLALWLDQGQEGACVGFGYSHEAAASPVMVKGLTNQYARETVYWGAQKIDDMPGGSYPGAKPAYEGTSVLAGAQQMQALGYYAAYHWGLTLQELVLGIGYTGPAVLGVDWYDGMYEPDAKYWIHVTGPIAGGHCILAVGVKVVYRTGAEKVWANVDLDKSYILLHNSWGQSWGLNGRAKLSLRDMGRLIDAKAESCFPTRTSKTKI